jgi:hypothetical protein
MLFTWWQKLSSRQAGRPGTAAHRGSRRRRARLGVEGLEDRRVPAALTYVDDNWAFVADNDHNGMLSVGDTVTNSNDTINPGGITATYGMNAFGTVTTGAHTGSVAGSATINNAIDNTSASTIDVLEGTYNELVQVDRAVTLKGAQAGVDARTGRPGAAESIIDGSNQGGVVQVIASNVVVDGFTMQGDASVSAFNNGLNTGLTMSQSPANVSGLHAVNNIIQHVPIGIAPAGDLDVIQFNLIRNTDVPGPAGGTGLYTDFGLTNALIDSNKFVNNQNTAVNLNTSGSNNVVSNDAMDSQIYLEAQPGSQVTGNTITNSFSGGVVLGGGQSGITVTNNEVNGVASGFSAFRLRDDGAGPNSGPTVMNNKFVGGALGFGVRPGAGSYSGTLTLLYNEIAGGSAALQNDDASLVIDASLNYWETSSPTAVSVLGAGAANVDFTPMLDHGDANAGQVGFQQDLSSVTVHTRGAQLGSTGRIQEGVNTVTAGGTVHVAAGTYAENVTINKALSLLGAQAGVNANTRFAAFTTGPNGPKADPTV